MTTADPWAWWRAQLAGENPETTPGTPHAGYYRLRKWVRNPARPGKREVKIIPVALFQFEGAWFVAIGGGIPRQVDLHDADNLFASCCRNAITYEEYEREAYGNENQ